jgi:hypothetical protein
MNIFLTFVFISLSANCMAETYLSANISDDGKTLLITTDHGTIKAPRTDPNQEGFTDIHISSNGKLIGWLVETSNCCNSYPLPLSLVIFQDGKVIQQFDHVSTIVAWGFERQDTAVAYNYQTAHFVTGIGYELRNISNAKLIQRFGCDVNYDGERHVFSKNVPSWVWPLRQREDCPYTTERPD